MSVVRVSLIDVPAERLDEVAKRLEDAAAELAGIRKLRGLRTYVAGVDRRTSRLTNVSVWDSVEDAEQMSSFQPMLDLATEFSSIERVTFLPPIPNLEALWEWDDPSGA